MLKWNRFALFAAAFLMAYAAPLAAAESPEQRIRRLESTFIAPCCWQDIVKDHRSEAALEMKREIALFVSQGKTDRQVIEYYRQKYGARVLVEPEGPQFWVMNIIPWVILGMAAIFLMFLLKRMLRPGPEPVPAQGADLADFD